MEHRNCTCKDCNINFVTLKFPETHYGDLLMRTKTGEIKILYALDSKEYHVYRILIRKDLRLKQMTDQEKSTVVQSLFGIACDLGNDGNPFSITQKPICPQCEQANVDVGGLVIPIVTGNNDFEEITHQRWNVLNTQEKEDLIEKAISTYLKNTPPEKAVLMQKRKSFFRNLFGF